MFTAFSILLYLLVKTTPYYYLVKYHELFSSLLFFLFLFLFLFLLFFFFFFFFYFYFIFLFLFSFYYKTQLTILCHIISNIKLSINSSPLVALVVDFCILTRSFGERTIENKTAIESLKRKQINKKKKKNEKLETG
jgi:hypothetical protein